MFELSDSLYLSNLLPFEQLQAATAFVFDVQEQEVSLVPITPNPIYPDDIKIALFMEVEAGDFPLLVMLYFIDRTLALPLEPPHAASLLVRLCEKLACPILINPDKAYSPNYLLVNRLSTPQWVIIDLDFHYQHNRLKIIEYGELLEEVS